MCNIYLYKYLQLCLITYIKILIVEFYIYLSKTFKEGCAIYFNKVANGISYFRKSSPLYNCISETLLAVFTTLNIRGLCILQFIVIQNNNAIRYL